MPWLIVVLRVSITIGLVVMAVDECRAWHKGKQ